MPPSRQKKEELVRRRNAVRQLLSSQVSSGDIVRTVSKRFGCKERSVYGDLELIRLEWQKEAEYEKPMRVDQMRKSFQQLMQRAMQDKDYKTCVQILDRLCKLDGLFEPMKVDVKNTIEKMTSDDKRRRLDELLKKAQQLAAAQQGDAKANGHANGKANGSGNGLAN